MRIIITTVIFITLLHSAQSQTTLNGSFTFEGNVRTYRIYVPASYTGAQPVPLVFNLHGLYSDATQQEMIGDFRPIADTANFIVVHANGMIVSGTQSWNTGFSSSTANDVGFLEALIDTMAANYNINMSRVYSTGMSNGGFMSHLLACTSNRFAAIASVTGTMTVTYFNACAPVQPIPVMQIHGTSDFVVAYNGSAQFKPVEDIVAHWVNHNNIPTIPVMTPVPNIVTTDNSTAEHYVYSTGTNGTTVEFFKVIGGGHTWPGSSFPLPTGATCMDFNACVEIWRFFSQFENLNVSVPNISTDPQVSIWPNPVSEILNVSTSVGSIHTMVITDIQGSVLLVKSGSNLTDISIKKLASGIYIVHAETQSGIGRMKFVKK